MSARSGSSTRRPLPKWVSGAIGFVGLLVVWQMIGWWWNQHGTVPPPTDIIKQMNSDGFEFYWNNARTTLQEAGLGYIYGNLIAMAVALLVVIVPFLEKPLLSLGIAAYCVPIIAIGPILQITFDGQTPKVILAALAVFFTTLVGTVLGLRSADKTSLDVIRAYGGGRTKQVTKVRLKAAQPAVFAALRIAAPAAILGAIIGEYLGAESGLGVAMINSQQGLMIDRTWAIALVATFIAGMAFLITAMLGKALTPWAPRGYR